MNKLGVNNKKKYVKPQMECYVINNPCLLLVQTRNKKIHVKLPILTEN